MHQATLGRHRPLHVLLVSNRFETDPSAGGTEILTADLATALAARHVEVTWLATAMNLPTEQPGRGRVGTMRRVRVDVESAAAAPAAWQTREPVHARRVATALSSIPPIDLVHLTHFSRVGLCFLEHGALREVPVVATLTDYTVVCADYQLVHRRTRRPCVPPVSASVCASCLSGAAEGRGSPTAEEVEEWRQRNLAILNNRVGAIWVQTPHQRHQLAEAGLDGNRIVNDAASYAVPASWRRTSRSAGEPILLFLGRASPEKGLHVLLDAVAAWCRPARLRIVTTPDDVEYESQLRHTTSHDSRIDWLPAVTRDDLIYLLNSATALLVPSQWDDNHPMVVHYAMALGLPVLCSAVASLAHLPAMADVRLVDRYWDAAAWTRALEELLDRPPRSAIDRTEEFRRAYGEFVDATVSIYLHQVSR